MTVRDAMLDADKGRGVCFVDAGIMTGNAELQQPLTSASPRRKGPASRRTSTMFWWEE
jgi:hypothetical protein